MSADLEEEEEAGSGEIDQLWFQTAARVFSNWLFVAGMASVPGRESSPYVRHRLRRYQREESNMFTLRF